MQNILKIRVEDVGPLLLGRARIVNIPFGCQSSMPYLREGYADRGAIALLISHSSFTERREFWAAVVEGADVESPGDIPIYYPPALIEERRG